MLKTLVNFAILTTIVIAVWVFVSIYDSLTSTTITDTVAGQIKPIQPSFDTNAISNLRERTFIPTDLSENISSSSSVVQPTQPAKPETELETSPTPIATGSGALIPPNL